MVLSCRSWPAFAALWCASLILLRYAYPIYFDGAGPMPSFFYWGHLPGMAEYKQHTWHYELRFLIHSVLHCIHYPRIRLSVRCSQGGQPPHGTPQVRRAFSQLAGIAICCSSSIGHGQRHVVKRRGVFWNRNLFVHETADCELALSHHFRPACRCHRQIIDEKTSSYHAI